MGRALAGGLMAIALCATQPAFGEEKAEATPKELPKLSLKVAEKGPSRPWSMTIVNEGNGSAELTADSRLLWFDVLVPGKKKKKTTCRLPAESFPAHPDRKTAVVLAPGEGVEQSFDPRLYCFAAGGQYQLVPGTIVTPHFGWPEKKKTIWKRGKKIEDAGKQDPPFVTKAAPEPGEPKKWDAPGVKELNAEPFALRSEYAEWSRTRFDRDKSVDEENPLVIKAVQGSDASAERTATIQVTVTNKSKQKMDVYFRRELISYEVVRPDGPATCDAEPDVRAPDRQAFHRLGPGGSISVVSRLVELCPTGTFGQPGLYLVHARFDPSATGEEFGLDAFTGRVVSRTPATVRIRTGEQSLVQKKEMRRIKTPE